MTIDENYTQKLVDTVAKTLVEAFENLTIDDVNMYRLGYTKAIDDFVKKIISEAYINNGFSTMRVSYIKELAEQLKEGVDNE